MKKCTIVYLLGVLIGAIAISHAQTKRITWIDGKDYDVTPVATQPPTEPPTTQPPTTQPPTEPPATQPAAAKPGPHNTGFTVPASELVKWAGGATTKDGQIIENVDIGPNARIDVRHSNVTIKNFRLNGGTQIYPINVAVGVTGLVVEDGEIIGGTGAAIYGHHWTARRLNVHHCGSDGFKPFSFVTIEGCWVHHLGTSPGSHADGAQIGEGGLHGKLAEKFIVRGNNWDMPIPLPGTASNACLFINPATGDGKLSDVLIEDNWFNGGNYTLYILGNSTNVRVRNNRFGRNYRYGILSLYAPRPVWENNVWEDTGAAVPAPK